MVLQVKRKYRVQTLGSVRLLVFLPHSYIEFPCSLVLHEGRLFVSLGVNDDKAFVLELDPSSLPENFHDISEISDRDP